MAVDTFNLDTTSPKREFSVANEHTYDRRGPIRWVLSHLLRYKGLMVSFLTAAVLTNILFSSVPRLIGLTFDEVLQPDADPQRLLWLSLTVLGIILVRGLLDLTNSFSVETLGQRMERDAREELYISLLGKSQTFHNRQRVGDIMARASNDVRQLNPMMNPGVALMTESLSGIISPLVFIAFIDTRLLVAPILFVIAFLFALRHYVNQLNPVSGKQRMQFGVLNAGLNETISGIEVVKSMAQEAQERDRFMQNASQVSGLLRTPGRDSGALSAAAAAGRCLHRRLRPRSLPLLDR